MPVTSTLVLAYFDLSHTAPNLPQCPLMFILITAAATAVWAAGGRPPGGGPACRTGLRGQPLFGTSLSLSRPLCCWTRLVFWRSWRQKESSDEYWNFSNQYWYCYYINIKQWQQVLLTPVFSLCRTRTLTCIWRVHTWKDTHTFMIIIKYWNSHRRSTHT